MKCQYLQFNYLYFSSITYTFTNSRHFCPLSGLMVLGLTAKTPPPGPTTLTVTQPVPTAMLPGLTTSTTPPGQATARPSLDAVAVVRRNVV